jgi:hypothetical protein
MFDRFDILSGGVWYSHEFGKPQDWLMERTNPNATSTLVFLRLNNHTSRTETKIFDQYASAEDYVFKKTTVPVRVAQYGSDKLVPRSQAKRVVARIEVFRTVVFDFQGVSTVGQTFADEVFRVFARQHPEIEIVCQNANSEVQRMIARARAGLAEGDLPTSVT